MYCVKPMQLIYVLRETARNNINVKLMFDYPWVGVPGAWVGVPGAWVGVPGARVGVPDGVARV